VDTTAQFRYENKDVPPNSIAFKINVSGLKGGHSGDEIHKGLGNSNKIVTRFLWQLGKRIKYRLAEFDGGNLRNAIPREAFAIFTTKHFVKDEVFELFNKYSSEVKKEFKIVDPDLEIKLVNVETPNKVINKKIQRNLINSLYACPHGVFAFSKEIPGLVETSTNMASVKFLENNIIEVITSQRSSVESSKRNISYKVESVFLLAGATVWHNSGYPGWKPNTDSEILKLSEKSYKKLFAKEPQVKAIHAGLECGLFLTKYPQLDMISFGPTIKGAHSPDERMEISTVKMFWDLLVDILENIPIK
jgi:dipeptidase D